MKVAIYIARSPSRCVGCGYPQGYAHARSCAFARFTWSGNGR
jgi:hypothetical protein